MDKKAERGLLGMEGYNGGRNGEDHQKIILKMLK